MKLYYSAPSEESFLDMKSTCIGFWEEMDNTYGYVDEKVSRIKNIENIQDNFMFIFAMFDHINQFHVLNRLKPQTKIEVILRLESVNQNTVL